MHIQNTHAHTHWFKYSLHAQYSHILRHKHTQIDSEKQTRAIG